MLAEPGKWLDGDTLLFKRTSETRHEMVDTMWPESTVTPVDFDGIREKGGQEAGQKDKCYDFNVLLAKADFQVREGSTEM
jgi:hypothetical protein